MRLPLLALAACLAVTTGCSGTTEDDSPKQPAASAFAEGTCREVAPDVLLIGREADQLGKGPEVDRDRLGRLEAAQGRVKALAEAAEPAYKPALDDLVVAVGLVRLQGQVGRYKSEQGENLRMRYRAVLDACT